MLPYFLFALSRLTRSTRARDERGDVPGWVLITVMTAGLVTVIWGVADDQLRSMLTTALGAVSP